MSDTTLQFRPQVLPTILMVLLAPLFIVLGFWQLDRAEQKRSIAGSMELRRKLPTMPLTGKLTQTTELEYRRVSANGRFLEDKTVLIENRKHQGKTGFHVITPLRLSESGQVVLVNRGWIPQPPDMAQLRIPSIKGMQQILGVINLPQAPALDLKLELDRQAAMPRWPYLTLQHYAAWSGLDILPFVILQSAHDNGPFVRQWPRPQTNDAMHIGYAIQWFAFALISLLIWLRLSLQKQTPPRGERP